MRYPLGQWISPQTPRQVTLFGGRHQSTWVPGCHPAGAAGSRSCSSLGTPLYVFSSGACAYSAYLL